MILYHNHPHRRIYRSNRTESIFHRPLASPEYAHLVFLRWLMLFALTLLRSVYLRPLFQKAALLFLLNFCFNCLNIIATATAWPKVAEYSNANPSRVNLSRRRIQAPAALPVPLCPSSIRTRLLPSNASTATVLSPISSASLLISITSIVPLKGADLLLSNNWYWVNPEFSSSSKCCFDRRSSGVSRMILSG